MTINALLFKGGMDPWIAAVIAIAASALIGLIMGLLVTKLGLTHFIVTLAFMGIIRGLVLILSTGTPISIVSVLSQHPLFMGLGQGKLFGSGDMFPTQFPVQVIIFIVLAVIADYIVRHSSAMRIVFYTGSNPKAAEYSGINTQKTIIIVGVVCSTLAGFAGVIYLSKFAGVPMSAGSGLEMTALSAAVIGGASLTGGKGTILGSILGLVLMQLATNALTLYSVSTFWYDFIRYSILLVAVVLDQIQQVFAKRRAA
jgi:ribose transport system permease protein